MNAPITLAVDIDADASRIFEILSTTGGQRAFWTDDCDVAGERARFGFPEAPVDLEVDVTTEPDKLVRMRVTRGWPGWTGSTWEWEMGPATRSDSGAGVLFRHCGFGEGYQETDLGHTSHTWAQILDRLAAYAAGSPVHPFFHARP
ncbi:hypothetical protein [Streptomyces sp. NPDC052107]|uniref:hypothetical protein n=1 Tax=Streptomyces sp. NPDC052107 TaxID=3155632 RepID=UPI0034299264